MLEAEVESIAAKKLTLEIISLVFFGLNAEPIQPREITGSFLDFEILRMTVILV